MTTSDEKLRGSSPATDQESLALQFIALRRARWQQFQLIGLAVLLFFALRFAYVTYIFDLAAPGFDPWWHPAPDTSWPMIWSLLLVVVTAAFVTRRLETLSDYLVVLAFVTPVLPMIVVFSDRAIALQFVAVSCAALVALSFIARAPFSLRGITPSLNAVSPRVPLRWLRTAVIVVVAMTITLAVAIGGLSSFNLDLSRVYEFRRFNVVADNVILGYLTSNVMTLAVPFGMALALSRRRYWLVVGFFVVAVIIGGITSHKSHMFTPVLVLAVYFLLGRRRPAKWILWTGIGCALLIGLWEFFGRSSSLVGSFTVWRQFFVPAYTNLIHYDFFTEQNAPFFQWSQSRASFGLTSSDYPFPSSQVLGNFYNGRPFDYNLADYSNMNTGWLGSGFAELGYIGVATYTIVLGLMLRVADRLSAALGFRVAGTAVSISLTGVFTSSDVATAFLSFGLLGILVLTAMSRKPDTASDGADATVSERNDTHRALAP